MPWGLEKVTLAPERGVVVVVWMRRLVITEGPGKRRVRLCLGGFGTLLFYFLPFLYPCHVLIFNGGHLFLVYGIA